MSKARELASLGNAYSDGALSNRNLIINGSHIVNQRGIASVTTGVGSPTFTTDRWISYANGQAVNITIQEVTLPDGTVANSHKTTSTTTTTDWLHPFQKVETFGKSYLRGKTVTISTWVRTNMSGQRIRICDTTNCYALGAEIPSDGAWHYVTATHTMPSGMATGASDYIQIHPAFGTTNTVSGSYIEFTMTQFEVGDTATPFEHRSYGQELALCQRYYVKHTEGYNSPIGVALYEASNVLVTVCNFPVEMRSAPTLVAPSGTDYYFTYPFGDTFNSLVIAVPSTKRTLVFNNSNVSGTTGNATTTRIYNGSAYVAFDAEL